MQRPKHIVELLWELDDVLLPEQHATLTAYLRTLECEAKAQRQSAGRMGSIRDREERAFQKRLAELKATQTVRVVHGGRIS